MLIYLVTNLFLFSEKSYLVRGNFPPGNCHFLFFWQESFLSPELGFQELHFILQKMLITVTTTVTLLVYAVSIAISLAFMLSLEVVAVTMIRRGLVDK